MPTLLMLPPQSATTRAWAARLAEALPGLEIVVAEDAAEAARVATHAEAAFGTMPPAVVRKAAKLRWLQAPQAAPPAGYYTPELVAHPAVVTNPRDLQRPHRRPHHGLRAGFCAGLSAVHAATAPAPVAAGVGRDQRRVYLPETTALIVGVGGIGAETARLCAAFGMHVMGVDARRREAPPGVHKLDGPDALDSLLPLADFVILTVPQTPATEGFMNRARLQRMKRTAYFINIGRGMTTRLDDLVAALRAGEIAGAALDVFEQEPLPADHPLWTLPNVLITPHTAGHGPYLDERRFEVLLDNARRFVAGQPLRNVVDKAGWF